MKKTGIKWMENKTFLPRLYDWPDNVSVACVERDGEFAFVPKSVDANKVKVFNETQGTNMWSYELAQPDKDFWATERPSCSIWVDLSNI
jgi:outer membrane protein assembly factor BamB